MTTELTIEKLRDIVALARSHFDTENLIIAGGAPRDILHGVPVKDIDIFVKLSGEQLTAEEGDFTFFEKTCHALAGCAEFCTFKVNKPEYPFDFCEIDKPGVPCPVQIIALIDTDPVEDVFSYDFALSQMYVGRRGLFMTQAAVLDHFMGTITYTGTTLNNEASFKRTVARLARLRQKYVGLWEFVNCAILHRPFVDPESGL